MLTARSVPGAFLCIQENKFVNIICRICTNLLDVNKTFVLLCFDKDLHKKTE